MLKIALQLDTTKNDALFAKELGVRHVVWNEGAGTDNGYMTLEVLQRTVDFFNSYDLELGVVENVPFQYLDKVLLGLPGRDRQVIEVELQFVDVAQEFAADPIIDGFGGTLGQ